MTITDLGLPAAAPCYRCDHPGVAHGHLRRGTECALCDCREYTGPPSRRRLVVAALILLAALAVAALVMLMAAARAGTIDSRPAARPARAELVVKEIFCARGYHRAWDARHHRYVCVKNRRTP